MQKIEEVTSLASALRSTKIALTVDSLILIKLT